MTKTNWDAYCTIIKKINTLASGWFWRLLQKNSSFQLPYQRPSSSADCARELFNSSNGSASLVDCTWKKFFCLGVRVFCQWCHKWRTFRPLCLALGANRYKVVFHWSFYWKLGYNWVFWYFGWPAGVSGSKVVM